MDFWVILTLIGVTIVTVCSLIGYYHVISPGVDTIRFLFEEKKIVKIKVTQKGRLHASSSWSLVLCGSDGSEIVYSHALSREPSSVGGDTPIVNDIKKALQGYTGGRIAQYAWLLSFQPDAEFQHIMDLSNSGWSLKLT